jgi:hypothetical protein
MADTTDILQSHIDYFSAPGVPDTESIHEIRALLRELQERRKRDLPPDLLPVAEPPWSPNEVGAMDGELACVLRLIAQARLTSLDERARLLADNRELRERLHRRDYYLAMIAEEANKACDLDVLHPHPDGALRSIAKFAAQAKGGGAAHQPQQAASETRAGE